MLPVQGAGYGAARPFRPRTAVLALLCVAASAVGLPASGSAAAQSAAGDPPTGSVFVPVEPCRLLDTREHPGRPMSAGQTQAIFIAGLCGVPTGARAAALTIAVVQPDAAGFAVMFPAGTDRPTASTVNYRTGQVVANTQLTRLGDHGGLAVYTLAAAHVVIDVTGYFIAPDSGGPGDSGAGRFVAVPATRLADTRQTARPNAGAAVRVTAGAVPADAIAVAVNLTTADANGPDFFTAYAAGAARPNASALNVDRAHQSRAASVIVPVAGRAFDVYTARGNHVIVDLLGYFTGDSAATSGDGLFVPVAPTRLVDTRAAAGPPGGPRLWDAGARELGVATHIDAAGLDADEVAAVSANVTVTDTEDAGFLALAAAGSPPSGTSSINYPTAQMTVANAAIVALSPRGVRASASSATHLIVDITGFFTGPPAAAAEPPPANLPPADRKVTIISDSAIAGVRWNGALAGLQGFVVDHRMESCRRLVATSCRGREGYRPRTVVAELAVLPAVGPEDVLVIATGYDDWWDRFSADFDTVMASARAKGFRHVVWLTFRADVDYAYADSYAAMNGILWSKVASGEYPEVRVWDYAAYTATSPGWFASDDIHLTQLGAWGTADWISRQVRAFDDRPCPQPWRPGVPIDDPCPDPDPLPPTRGLPDIRGLYNL